MASQGSLQVRNRTSRQADSLLPEIMGIIFEQLDPKSSRPEYEPDVKKTLVSCLGVSGYCRDFALDRLFQSIEINIWDGSSLPKLDLLLEILCPLTLRVQWMTVLPYIQHFILRVGCHYNKGFDLAEPGLLRLLSVLGDQDHKLKRLALRLRACAFPQCCHFTKAFQSAVWSLLKIPHIQIVEIEGAGFLSPDFLCGTYISQLEIFAYDPGSYPRNSDGTLASSRPSDEEMKGDSRVRSLTTDTLFPFRLETPAAANLLEGLDDLTINIFDDGEDIYRKVADILRSSTSLKRLTLHYEEAYGFCSSIVHWDTNFGEMQALETLEISIGIQSIEDDKDFNSIVSGGTEALDLLFSALNTMVLPMPRLARLLWRYSFLLAGSEELPFPLFEGWLRTSAAWETLDKMLTSDLFPVLSEIKLTFNIPRLNLRADEDNAEGWQGSSVEMTTRMRHAREDLFPRSVAALGEDFKLVLTY